MPDFKTNKEKVEYLLEQFPETRDSDVKLYLAYCQVFTNYDLSKTTLLDFLENHENYPDVPNTKTLYRNRCKVQRERTDLVPSEEVIAIRRHLQEQYHDYYRE